MREEETVVLVVVVSTERGGGDGDGLSRGIGACSTMEACEMAITQRHSLNLALGGVVVFSEGGQV